MENHGNDIKQKNWNNIKAAVGTMVSQKKLGKSMSLDELLLNINAVDFNSIVRQTEIKTEEDKKYYQSKGYFIQHTEEEFKKKFDVDPSCICYTPSISHSCLYFNEQTLAATLFPIELVSSGIHYQVDDLYQAVQERETDAANNDYWGSLLSLSDGMKMEYFKMLVEKKGTEVPELYNLFFSNYVNSDYGFNNIDPKTLNAILSAKTEADKEKTRANLEKLPEVFTIYRGGNSASTPYEQAYSWTLDVNVANFFACRRGIDEGYIVEAEATKKDVIEYFPDDRGENEVIINPEKLKVLQEHRIKGLDYLEDTLPQIAPMYHKYLSQLEKLEFAQQSAAHGCEHEARVLLLALTIAHELKLPSSDVKALATAAIYHDTQRKNDKIDSEHGKAAKDYYRATVKNPDPVVEFLCEYHCLPDELGYKEIMNNRKLSKNRSRTKLLLDVFKDSDALDRVRFGIRALDLNQLRLPVSKQLSLVARLNYDHVEVSIKPKTVKRSLDMQIESAKSQISEINASMPQKNRDITQTR